MEAVAQSYPPQKLDPRLVGEGILDQHRHRLSRADYQRMAEAGIFGEDDHIELIDGELVDMPPIGTEHAGLTTQLNHIFGHACSKKALVTVQSPLVLDDHSEPEPDLLLLRFRQDYYKHAKPRPDDVLLLVEVADSSLGYDRSIKLPLYARHGIAEVWILNLQDRVIEIHREPDGKVFQQHFVARAGDLLHPLLAPGIAIAVADLLE